ncbi:hypothetical protein [Nitrosospira sp. Nsp13]|uniref:hypothetical protein n=1 Tax=Nitrosospira sp. Nsp13 TaxID=1855332 RepID=UPI0015863D81|nr:hypothetical protein [Nitrosospira sp. Nsp13]
MLNSHFAPMPHESSKTRLLVRAISSYTGHLTAHPLKGVQRGLSEVGVPGKTMGSARR